ncbi:MAG TPA: isoprenylcysteine carboxylmethyltransferase family protein [Lacipirellulaceae bacterium]
MWLNVVLRWLPLVVLGAMLIISRLQVRAMRRRGLRVMVVDRERPARQMIYDSLIVAVFLFWFYLLVAEALSLPLAWLPDWFASRPLDALPLKIAGAILLVAVPLAFAAAIRAMDASWRMGIDRNEPGPLVTTGLFAYSRNPIYMAFDMMFVAAFLIHGRIIFLIVAAAFILLLHGVILREERFLAGRFGDEFRDYCNRVGRYSPLG